MKTNDPTLQASPANNAGTSEYTPNEELANSLSHGAGAVFSLLGLAILLYNSTHMDDIWRTVSFSIYGASLFLLYLSSTLYHSLSHTQHHKLLKTLDHCAIYLLIAGSYTPFLLVTMHGTTGWTLFTIVWLIAAIGIGLKIAFSHRFHKTRVATYLIMGWLVVAAGEELTSALAGGGLALLVAGGLFYSLGVIFYVGHRIPFNHAIWHLFVLGGSLCHYFAVFYYVLPENT